MKPTVYVPEKIAAGGMDLLRGECEVVAPWASAGASPAPPPPVDTALLNTADAVIVRLFRMDAAAIQRSPRLRVIAKHGVGVDNIDVPAASARKIAVVFTPAANANAVAEHTITLMLALARQIAPADAAVRAGRFAERGRFEGVELAGKTLGVAGLGRVGSRVAEIAAAGLGMRVLGFDPVLSPGAYRGPATLVSSFEALLGSCDFLTLHVPLTAETRHALNAQSFARLKPGCRIVNTSRGGVIDEAALAAALHRGQLAGAALDVFDSEPLPTHHPLCAAPNLLLTPHISSSTTESLDRMSTDAAQGVLDVLAGRVPKYLVNPTPEPAA